MSNSSQSTRPVSTSPTGRVLWEELLEEVITYYSLMFFIAYVFKGPVHVFAGRVKILSHSSSRTSAILKYFCPGVITLPACTCSTRVEAITLCFIHGRQPA